MPDTTPTPLRRKLPIGLQALREIRESECYYVDKSGLAVDLIDSGKAYFLSRPRRFGKSLLIDTFKELFEGNRALFEGLAAEARWDWTRRYPVIRISFAGGELHSRAALDQRIAELIDEHAERQGVTLRNQSLSGRFEELLRRAHRQTGERVVVLIKTGGKRKLTNMAVNVPPTAVSQYKDAWHLLQSGTE